MNEYVLIARDNDFMLPTGGTVLQSNDTLLVLADKNSFDHVRSKYQLS